MGDILHSYLKQKHPTVSAFPSDLVNPDLFMCRNGTSAMSIGMGNLVSEEACSNHAPQWYSPCSACRKSQFNPCYHLTKDLWVCSYAKYPLLVKKASPVSNPDASPSLPTPTTESKMCLSFEDSNCSCVSFKGKTAPTPLTKH